MKGEDREFALMIVGNTGVASNAFDVLIIFKFFTWNIKSVAGR